MSHNKDIETYHKITNLPYSKCRKILKENNWNLGYALSPEYTKLLNIIRDTMQPVIDSLLPIAEAIVETMKPIVEMALKMSEMEDNTKDDIQ